MLVYKATDIILSTNITGGICVVHRKYVCIIEACVLLYELRLAWVCLPYGSVGGKS